MKRVRSTPPLPVPAPRTTPARFAPGDAVMVTGGMSKGAQGIVVARWANIGGVPTWRIDLPDARDRVIRDDYLTAAESGAA